MPQDITAVHTRDIVSWLIEEFNDNKRELFKTQGILFSKINSAQRVIARETKSIKEDAYIKLVPDKVYYNYAELPIVISDIVQIESVVTVDENDTESKPLSYKNQPTFEQIIKTDASIRLPKYYGFDEQQFFYWKPFSDATHRMLIRCSRYPHIDERVNYDKDPIIPTKYYEALKYKTAQLCCSIDDSLDGRANSYKRQYDEEMYELSVNLKTLDTHTQIYSDRL